jgi:hypothetical protein
MSKVTLKVVLKHCHQCRYIDHSGAFTIGGARDICGHYDAKEHFPKKTKQEFYKEYPAYAKREPIPDEHWPYHWYNRIIPDVNQIPDCCPLKYGSEY